MAFLQLDLPDRPKEGRRLNLLNSWLILESATKTVDSFFQVFHDVRAQRHARGVSNDEEQDLLRAALVFSGAGLDAVIKQLIWDTLKEVLQRVPKARLKFQEFVARKLRKAVVADKNVIDLQYLASILSSDLPREKLKDDLIATLTAGSLQSVQELTRVAEYFGLSRDKIIDDRGKGSAVFDARNEIVHEMDVDFGQSNRNRRQRSRARMIADATTLLNMAICFYREVEKILLQPPVV